VSWLYIDTQSPLQKGMHDKPKGCLCGIGRPDIKRAHDQICLEDLCQMNLGCVCLGGVYVHVGRFGGWMAL